MTQPQELVHLALEGPVATITLDSPANRNALSVQLVDELFAHLQAATAREDVRAVILTHTGTSFCSGADLKGRLGSDPAGLAESARALSTMIQAIKSSPKPVIARVDGAARAGGVGLVAACDLSVVSDAATFAISEVRLGLLAAIISIVILPKISTARASELFLTGEPFSAGDAEAWGLVNRCVPRAALDAAVATFVGRFLLCAPGAVAQAKAMVRDVPQLPLAQAFAAMEQRSAETFASVEGIEGIRSFFEKRPPSWQLPAPS